MFQSTAQGYFDYDDGVVRAYEAVTDLDFEEGRQILDSLHRVTPHNLAIVHVENYLDFFTLFISEKATDFASLKANKEQRLAALKIAGPNDPYLPFVEAEILLQWALIRSKFDELILSARELYKAYNILEDAKETHPDFLLYNKSLSIIHALAETIPLPGFFKDLFGVSGTIDQGVEEIQTLITAVESRGQWQVFHLSLIHI